MMPASAIAPDVRRRICDEQGHDWRGDSCLRCRETRPRLNEGDEVVLLHHGPIRLVRVVRAPHHADRVLVALDDEHERWVNRSLLAARNDPRFGRRFL